MYTLELNDPNISWAELSRLIKIGITNDIISYENIVSWNEVYFWKCMNDKPLNTKSNITYVPSSIPW